MGKFRRDSLAWAFYDWANSAFATTVMAVFFPVFLKQFASQGSDPAISTLQLGTANSAASALLALLSPVLGAIADQMGGRKKFLALFAFMGLLTTGALALVADGDWPTAILLYAVASIGFAGANSFYDALLVDVARPGEMNRVSSLGFGLGYLGGGVLLTVNVMMKVKPEWFGLNGEEQAIRASFVTVAFWWSVFALPLLFWVKERKPAARPGFAEVVRGGFRQLARTFADLRALKPLLLFLFAYFFYIDGVATVMKMAVAYGLDLGFKTNDLVLALLLTQFIGFPAAIVNGMIAHRFGAKPTLIVCILVYMLVTVWGYLMTEPWEFYVLAGVIGLVQGGVQALSRSVFGEMIPKDQAGEYFGFYNMLGKASAIMGPLLVGAVQYFSPEQRHSLLSLMILFVIGLGAFVFVKIPDSPAASAEWPERQRA